MSRPTLLLLHGALGSPATLAPLAEQLAADFTVKTLAFAGHGGRPVQPETFTLPHFAQEVLDFLAAHETGPAHVFGYSMGGYAALLAAAREPGRFASLTALGTTVDWAPDLVATATGFMDPANIAARFPGFAEQLRQRHAPADWTAVVTATARLIAAAGAARFLQAEDFADLRAPVHLLMGDADQAAGPEALAALAARLPQGRFEVLPHTPHPLERVDLAMLSGRIRSLIFSSNA